MILQSHLEQLTESIYQLVDIINIIIANVLFKAGDKSKQKLNRT